MGTRIDYGISSHILMHSYCPPNASKVERISTKALTGDKAQHLEVSEGGRDHLEGVLGCDHATWRRAPTTFQLNCCSGLTNRQRWWPTERDAMGNIT